jgi:dephospho-CoA kinase
VVGIVGVAGLAGAGKTTAVEYFKRLTGGRVLYLGQSVLGQVRARGLSETRDNERGVRIDLRHEKGRAALALPYVGTIAQYLANKIPVFVDAIYTQEEFSVLKACFPPRSAHLLAIKASFAVRSTRLAKREERAYSCDELRKRDETELKKLGTGAVFAAAEHPIRNEKSLAGFYRDLAAFLDLCS